MRSTATAKIRRIVESRNWTALSAKDKYYAPVFTYDVLVPFINRYKKTGDAAAKQAQSVPELDRFINGDATKPISAYSVPFDEAMEAYEIMMALQLKRQPTRAELSVILSWINPPDPNEEYRLDGLQQDAAVEPEVERSPGGRGKGQEDHGTYDANTGKLVKIDQTWNQQMPGRAR